MGERVTEWRPGDRVAFAYPTHGRPRDQALARSVLQVARTYTIASIEVERWSSSLTLVEVPGLQFNTVLFEREPTS